MVLGVARHARTLTPALGVGNAGGRAGGTATCVLEAEAGTETAALVHAGPVLAKANKSSTRRITPRYTTRPR
jgi:hypothetical protein